MNSKQSPTNLELSFGGQLSGSVPNPFTIPFYFTPIHVYPRPNLNTVKGKATTTPST